LTAVTSSSTSLGGLCGNSGGTYSLHQAVGGNLVGAYKSGLLGGKGICNNWARYEATKCQYSNREAHVVYIYIALVGI